MSGKMRRSNEISYLGLTFLDILFSAFVVGPAVVGYWRGTWLLAEYYIFPGNATFSSWVSLAIGCSVHLIFLFMQGLYEKWLQSSNVVVFIVFSRVYTAVFSFACVNSWRGVWQTLEHYTGTELSALLVTTTAAVAALAVMRTLRNVASPPFAIVMDLQEGYFNFPTMFRVRTAGSKDPALHTLDCVFSVMVVGSLVVIVWRGTWGILDHVLLPQDPALSAWVSLGIGYGVTAAGFALQVPARVSCEKLSGAPRLIVADTYQFLCFCGTVNLWRGVWNLLNIYLLPESPLASYWLTHWACLLLLMVLCCGNSLLVRGVFIDGEEEGGQCVVFQCNYLRHRYQEKSKEQQAAQAAAQAALLEKRNKTEVEPARIMDNNIHVTLMAHDTLL